MEAFRKSHHRLPNGSEWRKVLNQDEEDPFAVRLVTPDFQFDMCGDDGEVFRRQVIDSYVLWVWRGEWAECAAPATGLTTLRLDAADYTITGARWSDTVLLMCIAGICLVGAFRISRPLFGQTADELSLIHI